MADIQESFLGISFSSNNIHFIELINDTGRTKLDHVETIEVDFDFEEDLSKYKSNNKALTNLSGEIQKFIKNRNRRYSKISLTLGTSQAFIITLPIDFSEGKQSLNSKIYWELSNYFPDNYGDFIVNTYRLNKVMPCGNTDEFLIIAVLKNTLEFVKRIFRLSNINLSIVDIDHFSAEYNLRKNKPEEFSKKNVILIGLKKGRFDFGLITGNKYSNYAYTKYYSEAEYNLALIRKLKVVLNSHFAKIPVDIIYLYGDHVSEDTIEALKEAVILKLN